MVKVHLTTLSSTLLAVLFLYQAHLANWYMWARRTTIIPYHTVLIFTIAEFCRLSQHINSAPDPNIVYAQRAGHEFSLISASVWLNSQLRLFLHSFNLLYYLELRLAFPLPVAHRQTFPRGYHPFSGENRGSDLPSDTGCPPSDLTLAGSGVVAAGVMITAAGAKCIEAAWKTKKRPLDLERQAYAII